LTFQIIGAVEWPAARQAGSICYLAVELTNIFPPDIEMAANDSETSEHQVVAVDPTKLCLVLTRGKTVLLKNLWNETREAAVLKVVGPGDDEIIDEPRVNQTRSRASPQKPHVNPPHHLVRQDGARYHSDGKAIPMGAQPSTEPGNIWRTLKSPDKQLVHPPIMDARIKARDIHGQGESRIKMRRNMRLDIPALDAAMAACQACQSGQQRPVVKPVLKSAQVAIDANNLSWLARP
jgi:hypothetical protein